MKENDVYGNSGLTLMSDVSRPSDKEMMDWLQDQLDECRYTNNVVYRVSKNRGIRLHETSMKGHADVRECLTAAM